MDPSDVRRAVDAAKATAETLGLQAGDAIVLRNSDRIAVRLLPCDSLVRIAPLSLHGGQARAGMAYEAEVARRLAETDAPMGELDPRVEPNVYVRDGFAFTYWTYYDELGGSEDLPPAGYADALARFHAGLRRIELPQAPHISVRIAGWTTSAAGRESTPELQDKDRDLLTTTFTEVSKAISASRSEQLLHGEPHPGNLLVTGKGPLFIDVGTCQRGPVEYDLAYVPEAVGEHYPGADRALLHQFRILMWAGVATMRWNRDDQLPDRDRHRIEALDNLRAALGKSPRQ